MVVNRITTMGGRAGGGAGAGRGGGGGAFASTYGTRGTFNLKGGEYGVQGVTGQQYPVVIFGNKKMGVEWFNNAADANAMIDKLTQNGFSFGKNAKTKRYTQAYQVAGNGKIVGLTTQKPKFRF